MSGFVMVVIVLSVSFSESFVFVCGMDAVVEDVPSESESAFDMIGMSIVYCIVAVLYWWAYTAIQIQLNKIRMIIVDPSCIVSSRLLSRWLVGWCLVSGSLLVWHVCLSFFTKNELSGSEPFVTQPFTCKIQTLMMFLRPSKYLSLVRVPGTSKRASSNHYHHHASLQSPIANRQNNSNNNT